MLFSLTSQVEHSADNARLIIYHSTLIKGPPTRDMSSPYADWAENSRQNE